MVLHLHQPRYNARTMQYYQTYRHIIDVLNAIPEARININVTGVLLETMENGDPDLIDGFRGLAESGQVYFTACGQSHPIFPIVLMRCGKDACRTQLEMDHDTKRRLLHVEPKYVRPPEYGCSDAVMDMYQECGFSGTIAQDQVFFQNRVGTDRAIVRPPKSGGGREFRIVARNDGFSNVIGFNGKGLDDYTAWLRDGDGTPEKLADDFSRRLLERSYGGVTLTDCDGEALGLWLQNSCVPPEKQNVLGPILRSIIDKGIRLVHLPELAESLPVMEAGEIPTGSYEPYGLWTWAGHPRHFRMWEAAEQCWEMHKRSGGDERVKRLAVDAMGSDWFWGASRGWSDYWTERPEECRKNIESIMAENAPVQEAALAAA